MDERVMVVMEAALLENLEITYSYPPLDGRLPQQILPMLCSCINRQCSER